jgi:hypothetical protein
VGTSNLLSVLRRVPKVRVWSTDVMIMVAMAALCRTRVRYTRLLLHLIGGDLAGGIEEGGDSSLEWWNSSSLRLL